MTRWKCRKCSYVYDPRLGDPDGGIPPGTPFEQIPDSWRCPVCGVSKRDFYTLGSPQPTAAATAGRPPAAPAPARPGRLAPPPPAAGWSVGSLKARR